MTARACKVSVNDMDGVTHTVEVSAESLYEAVARGLAAIRRYEWVGGIGEGLNTVQVTIPNVNIEHRVRIGDFQKWLARNGGSPREMTQRSKVREILKPAVSKR